MIWHSEQSQAVLSQLETDRDRGLTTEKAQAKLHKYGQNKLDEKPPRSMLQRFGDQMKNGMVIILLEIGRAHV